MFFQSIDAQDYDKVRSAQWDAERLNHWAKKLTAQLGKAIRGFPDADEYTPRKRPPASTQQSR